MATHTLLSSIDLVPVARATADAVVSLPAAARAWPVLTMYEDHSDAVRAALGDLPVLDVFATDAFADLSADVSNDLRALVSLVGHVLSAPPDAGVYLTAITYPYVTVCGVAASADVVQRKLAAAGLTVGLLADRPAATRESEATAIARATAACVLPGKLADEFRNFLTGTGPPSPALLAAEGHDADDTEDTVGALVSGCLTGAVERWHEAVSGRLLELWWATRSGDLLGADGLLHLGLGEEGLPPELGFDRAQVVADRFVACGVSRAQATLFAKGIEGESATWIAVRLLADLAVFSKADRVARAAMAAAIPMLGLVNAPSLRARVKSLLDQHHPALGCAALKALLAYDEGGAWAKVLDDRHLLTAAIDVDATLEGHLDLVKKVAAAQAAEKKPQAAPSLGQALLDWAQHRTPKEFLEGVAKAKQSSEKGTVDAAAFWQHLAQLFKDNPDDPLGLAGAEPYCLYMTTELPAPTGAAQEALLSWCESHPQGFGDYTKHFVKTLSKSTKGAKSAKSAKATDVAKVAKVAKVKPAKAAKKKPAR